MSQGQQPLKREGGNTQTRLSIARAARAHVRPLPRPPIDESGERWQAGGESGRDGGSVGSGLSYLGQHGTRGPEGLTQPGPIGECWAPSPGDKYIDSKSRVDNGRTDVSSQESPDTCSISTGSQRG